MLIEFGGDVCIIGARYLVLSGSLKNHFDTNLFQPNFFYRIKTMPSIKVKENEPFEVAMRRFKRAIEKTGLLTELRAREAYEKPTTERKRKKAAAAKRLQKRLRSQQLPPKLY